MAYRPARPGSEGNTRLMKQYGGGSEPPRQSYAKGYATGGAVRDANPSLVEGIEASGSAAKPNLSRSGRKAPGKDKKEAKTNITIVVAPKGGDDKAAMPMPPPGAGPAMPPPMPPMPPPGMAGPGGPPMPMRAKGGRVVKKAGGGEVDDPVSDYLRSNARTKKISQIGNTVAAGVAAPLAIVDPEPVGKALLGTIAAGSAAKAAADQKDHSRFKGAAKKFERSGVPGRPSSDPDENSGRKTGGRVARSVGGPAVAPKMKDGAGGGEGRLEKARKYGK